MTIMKRIGMVIAALFVACALSGSVTRVHADNYYGNGVHCNTHRCYVDWNQAISSIGNIIYHGFWNGVSSI